jgi:hypothetical protein
VGITNCTNPSPSECVRVGARQECARAGQECAKAGQECARRAGWPWGQGRSVLRQGKSVLEGLAGLGGKAGVC